MSKVLKSILTRLNNKGTIISLTALLVSLLCQFGLDVDSEKILGIVQTICSILILLGFSTGFFHICEETLTWKILGGYQIS